MTCMRVFNCLVSLKSPVLGAFMLPVLWALCAVIDLQSGSVVCSDFLGSVLCSVFLESLLACERCWVTPQNF